jgi:AraC-like DNA-binding protein
MEVSEETLDYQIYHNPEEKNSRTLLFIMEWIRMNIDKELTLDSIAREFNYSKAYLSRFFSEQTGYTLTQYIRKTRIERSKSLLLSLPLTIEEVASRCGFSDQKYFMKSFKKVENMTPSQFREAYRKTRLNND